ncbi:hypothetical protein RUND412_009844 [Rhizina undulata]
MDVTLDETASATLHDLEVRLRRIEFLLAGSCEDPSAELYAIRKSGRENTIRARLHALERDLFKVLSKSLKDKDMLELHSKYPEIFAPHPNHPPPSTLSSSEKAFSVLAVAPSYHHTASQLTSIRDTPIPDPTISTMLISLLPQIHRLEVVQETQSREIAELRKRSARLLERWYLVGIEGINECFAEWDERTLEVDKVLSRRLRARREEE